MSDRSRLIVLGLPGALSKEALKAHFGSINLPITDARILTNKAGHSRRVGFIGFANHADAEHARAWFNGTWLAGSRIKVEFAEEALTAPPSNIKSTAGINTDVAGATSAISEGAEMPSSSKRGASPEAETDADYLAKRMKRHVTDDVVPSDAMPTSIENSTAGGHSPSHRMPHSASTVEHTDANEQEPGRLFLRNLAYSVTQDTIREVFSKYGDVTEIHLPQGTGGANKGIAFVKFKDESHAETARLALDGKPFCGRLIHVLQASKLPRVGGREAVAAIGLKEGGYRQRKQVDLKERADQPFNWSSLYMTSDAVLTSLAAKYGVPKSDVVDMSSTDAAARLALAEAVIIQETKDYFQSHGVNVDSFTSATLRSKSTLLLKNLPPGSTHATIRSLLPEACTTRRIVVSPTGTLALFQIVDESRVSQALKALAYRKVGNSVLFVERAPANVWANDFADMQDDSQAKETAEVKSAASHTPTADPVFNDAKTLFVAGLPSSISPAAFKSLFQDLPGFTYAHCTRSSLKSDSVNKGTTLGFIGFSSPKDAENAKAAMSGHVVDGHVLQIQNSRASHRENQVDAPLQSTSQQSSKILIKNLPFEVNRKDLMKIVGWVEETALYQETTKLIRLIGIASAYGSVLSLRLPKNAQARSCGFAFVQFATSSEAASAQAALAHTHILGRHVVVEKAQ